MNGIIATARANPHTTYPGLVCGAVKILKAQACIQWPQYWGAINGWCEAIEAICIMWMGGAAVQAGMAATPDQLKELESKTAKAIESGNTTTFEKKP